jgi:hypothetical protein
MKGLFESSDESCERSGSPAIAHLLLFFGGRRGFDVPQLFKLKNTLDSGSLASVLSDELDRPQTASQR